MLLYQHPLFLSFLPLKVGIHWQIKKTFPHLSLKKIKLFLNYHTETPEYRINFQKKKHRYDLKGRKYPKKETIHKKSPPSKPNIITIPKLFVFPIANRWPVVPKLEEKIKIKPNQRKWYKIPIWFKRNNYWEKKFIVVPKKKIPCFSELKDKNIFLVAQEKNHQIIAIRGAKSPYFRIESF